MTLHVDSVTQIVPSDSDVGSAGGASGLNALARAAVGLVLAVGGGALAVGV